MKFLLPITLAMFLGGGLYAQNPPAPQDQQDTGGTTITGCLTKGTSTGEYVITDSKSGEKTTFAGPDRLESYVNPVRPVIARGHNVHCMIYVVSRAGLEPATTALKVRCSTN